MKKQILKLAACVVAATSINAQAEVKLEPILANTGPESHLPIAVQNSRWHMNDTNINSLTFRSMEKLYDTRKVTSFGPVARLSYEEKPLDFTYEFEGKTYTPKDFLDRTYTNAMLVMKDGKVIYEDYLNLSRPDDHFMAWSMTKSITSILIGIAFDQGLIESLDDDITDYLPELKKGAYKGVTIRQVLEMRSGVDYEERYDFANPGIAARNHIEALVKNVVRFVDVAKTIKRAHEPGEVFAYKTIDTGVLGLLLERVSNRSISSFTTQYLWEPLGAESYGFYIMDGPQGVGREFNGAGFNGTLRDFARIGDMMLNRGKFNGHQIVSESWVEASTRSTGDEKGPIDYGFQWWTFSHAEAYTAIGLQGQFIFVDPATNTVVVKLSYFPIEHTDDSVERETFTFFETISKWSPSK